MSFFKLLDRYRSAFSLSQEDAEEMQEMARIRDYPLYSKDYFTVHFPLLNLLDKENKETVEYKMNAEYEADHNFGMLNYGRAHISTNPALSYYFKDIQGAGFLEPGEVPFIKMKARRNFVYEEVVDDCPWLFRVFILDQ